MTSRTLDEDLLRQALVSEECPTPAEWHRLAAGDLNEAGAARLREHACTCPECAAEARLARLFEEPVAEDDATVQALVSDLRARRSPFVNEIDDERRATAGSAETGSGWRRFALAAALVLAMIGAGLLLVRPSQRPQVGAPGDGSALRGGIVALVAPLGEIDAPPAELSWTEVPEAAAYRVVLTRVDGRPVWTAEVELSRVRLSEDVLSALRPAVAYRWHVTSLDAWGSEIGRSSEGEFRVRPGS